MWQVGMEGSAPSRPPRQGRCPQRRTAWTPVGQNRWWNTFSSLFLTISLDGKRIQDVIPKASEDAKNYAWSVSFKSAKAEAEGTNAVLFEDMANLENGLDCKGSIIGLNLTATGWQPLSLTLPEPSIPTLRSGPT